MRKLMSTHTGSFPVPVYGGSASIWHLVDALAWLQASRGGYTLAEDVLDVVRVRAKRVIGLH